MTYKELKDLVKKHPDCFWDKEQRQKHSEYKYMLWLRQKDQEYESKK